MAKKTEWKVDEITNKYLQEVLNRTQVQIKALQQEWEEAFTLARQQSGAPEQVSYNFEKKKFVAREEEGDE